MSKPEDIPQDVWQVAQNICDQACMPEHYYTNGVVSAVQADIARAILAAKAEARDGIADMADAYADVEDISAIHAQTDNDNLFYRTREATLRAFGAAARTLNDEVNTAHKNSGDE